MRLRRLVYLVLILTLFLSGCTHRVETSMSDTSLRKLVNNYLLKKYDSKFEIKSIYTLDGGLFYGDSDTIKSFSLTCTDKEGVEFSTIVRDKKCYDDYQYNDIVAFVKNKLGCDDLYLSYGDKSFSRISGSHFLDTYFDGKNLSLILNNLCCVVYNENKVSKDFDISYLKELGSFRNIVLNFYNKEDFIKVGDSMSLLDNGIDNELSFPYLRDYSEVSSSNSNYTVVSDLIKGKAIVACDSDLVKLKKNISLNDFYLSNNRLGLKSKSYRLVRKDSTRNEFKISILDDDISTIVYKFSDPSGVVYKSGIIRENSCIIDVTNYNNVEYIDFAFLGE